jgi:hypothetical protein
MWDWSGDPEAVCAIACTQPVRSQVTLAVRNPIRLARAADAIAAGATDLKRLLAIDNSRSLHVGDQRAGRTCGPKPWAGTEKVFTSGPNGRIENFRRRKDYLQSAEAGRAGVKINHPRGTENTRD